MSVKFDSMKNAWNENGNGIKDISVRFIGKLKAKINLRFVDKFSKYFENWVRIYWVGGVGVQWRAYNKVDQTFIVIVKRKNFELCKLFFL